MVCGFMPLFRYDRTERVYDHPSNISLHRTAFGRRLKLSVRL